MSDSAKNSEEQKAAESNVDAFRDALGPFVVAAETTRMPMAFTDAKAPEYPIIFANKSFLAFTGYERETVLGQSFISLLTRGAPPEMATKLEELFNGASDIDPEIHSRREDGTEFWASVFVSPVLDEHGRTVQYFTSLVDLTKHRQEQAESEKLIDELNHRVKNTLSTVQSIIFQALRNSSDPVVIQESIEARLFALSRSHDLLSRENWKSGGLVDLLKEILEPFGVSDGRSERFVIEGEDIRLPPKATLALGIAFHELATNAVKYGAFSNETGTILIAWKLELTPQGDRLILHWREKDGPPVTPPARRGFGSQVIERGLAHELGGVVRLEYPAEGVRCTIDIPAPLVARHE